MKYNLIETDNVVDSILELNNISRYDLDRDYDFINKDEVFLNFKENLIENKSLKFLIVGDYDCDGICATTIIKRLLNHLNIESNYIIPSRINDGYGLNNRIVEIAKDNGFNAMFLVDNGIVANEQISLAKAYGIKVFIIDHHEYKDLPDDCFIIHSNIVSEKYSKLSAGGLAFALSKCIYDDDLSLVLGGLSTISDMMSVIGFNRYLIKEMMNILNSKDIYQMRLLNDNDDYSYTNLSFNVIPKINALSRMEPMGDANKLVQFFMADERTCRVTIEQINYVNEKRKQNTKTMSNEAFNLMNENSNICVVSSINFNEGLCGLVANRLMHSINKPVIVLALKDGVYKGSGRSIDSFNLYDSLMNYGLYESFGGHEGAVGLSIKEENFNSFIDYINTINFINKQANDDALLIDESLINLELLKQIEKLEPFGTNFKMPYIAIRNSSYRKILISNKYPKYQIRNDFSCICFNGNLDQIKPEYFIGVLRKDNYHKDSVQLLIEDLL